MERKQSVDDASVHLVVVPVFWLMVGTEDVHQSNAIEVTNGRVVFEDGGWNPVENCFFTKEQCLRHHGLLRSSERG